MDHIGPMADSSAGIAKLLTAIAGNDPLDPRQRGVIPSDFNFDYIEALGRGVEGLKIGIVREGFGLPETTVPASDPGVDTKVREAAEKFSTLGAKVEEVSLPEHILGMDVYSAIMMEGSTDYMLRGYGAGTNWQGYYQTSLYSALARGVKAHPKDIPAQVVSVMLTGEYLHRYYYSRYYHKGQNLRRVVRAGYDMLFETFDILIMPTCPIVATKRVDRDASIADTLASSFSMLRNTGVQDVTGHPSMSVPCGMHDGMPVGMMMTGRTLADNVLISASAAFESLGDWKKM
jgi:amidase